MWGQIERKKNDYKGLWINIWVDSGIMNYMSYIWKGYFVFGRMLKVNLYVIQEGFYLIERLSRCLDL